MPLAAGAQPAPSEDLQLCASQPSDELKLACFEALAAKYRDEAPAAEAPPAPAMAEPARDKQTAPADVSAEPAAPVEQAPAETEERPVAEPEDDVLRLQVINVTRTSGLGRLTFETGEGGTWRQTGSDRFHYPKDGPFDIEIRRGIMGDYQLRVAGSRRMTRVRRID